jgi:dihydrofolate reductase/thymidylate synthase
MVFNLIYAKDLNNGIAKENSIPWKIKSDMNWFKNLTSDFYIESERNIVVMGYKTWESIPSKFKPLNNRLNVIVTNTHYNDLTKEIEEKDIKDTIVTNNIDDVMEIYKTRNETMWIIGGKQIYDYFLPMADYVYATKIFDTFDCDLQIDDTSVLKNNYKLFFSSPIMRESGTNFQYLIYSNKNIPDCDEKRYRETSIINYITKNNLISLENSLDYNYLNLVKEILESNNNRETRNGETISIFGKHLKINLREGFPLLTTKKVFWKGILRELLWFINANTNSNDLESKGVKIWKGNTTREFLDNLNLPYQEGIGGPIYGWQWRKFNERYAWKDENGEEHFTEGNEKGFDQLQFIIDEIRSNPHSRRLMMSGWNPCQLDQMCLPPCHMSYQFYVNNGELSCQMYQRSADVFLGLPFNIASTALLTHIIAKHTELEVGHINICIGDAHIYTEHLEAVKTQMSRLDNNYFYLPKLVIKNRYENIEDYKEEDFEVIGYNSHPTITAKMLA